MKDSFLLPRIDTLLDRLNGATVISKTRPRIRLPSNWCRGRWIEKTTFRRNVGHWEFIVTPFGLCNTPATFQRMMNGIFAEELNSCVLVCLDDIFVYSDSVKEHWGHLRRALASLRVAKRYGRLQKCDDSKIRWLLGIWYISEVEFMLPLKRWSVWWNGLPHRLCTTWSHFGVRFTPSAFYSRIQ